MTTYTRKLPLKRKVRIEEGDAAFEDFVVMDLAELKLLYNSFVERYNACVMNGYITQSSVDLMLSLEQTLRTVQAKARQAQQQDGRAPYN